MAGLKRYDDKALIALGISVIIDVLIALFGLSARTGKMPRTPTQPIPVPLIDHWNTGHDEALNTENLLNTNHIAFIRKYSPHTRVF